MSQIRFQIGIPQAGSAARGAEGEQGLPQSLRPRAGSAARDAEERNRAAGSLSARSFSIGMRAQRTMPHNSQVQPSQQDTAAATVQPQQVTVRRTGATHTPTLHPSAGDTPVAVPLSAEASATSSESRDRDGHTGSGPLPTVAARISSLARSLFSSGSTNGKA